LKEGLTEAAGKGLGKVLGKTAETAADVADKAEAVADLLGGGYLPFGDLSSYTNPWVAPHDWAKREIYTQTVTVPGSWSYWWSDFKHKITCSEISCAKAGKSDPGCSCTSLQDGGALVTHPGYANPGPGGPGKGPAGW
jgi:hypothetical protein